MKLRTLLFAVLAATATVAKATDLSEPMILVAKPELVDPVFGSAVLVVTPLGNDLHAGFIVNRPTPFTLGQLFPEGEPSQKLVEPVYQGGPLSPDILFALIERKENPGGKSFQMMPGLYAALDAETVDRIIRTAPNHARLVAGLVVWQQGELAAEVKRGLWYVLEPDVHLALQQPSQGLWEELVSVSNMRANGI